MMDISKSVLRYCLLRNIVSLVVFARLAIVFEKWWIVLLAGLFTAWPDKKENKNENI